MTMIEEIRNIMHRNQAFEIATSDGQRFRIVHGDFAAVSPGGHSITVYDQTGHMHILQASTITTVTTKDLQDAETESH